jgi:hypothetical protein
MCIRDSYYSHVVFQVASAANATAESAGTNITAHFLKKEHLWPFAF